MVRTESYLHRMRARCRPSSVVAAFGASLTGLAELPLHFAASIGELAVALVLVFAIDAGRRSSYQKTKISGA